LWKGPITRDGKPTAVLPLLDRSLWRGWSEEDASCETGGGCEDGPASITGPVISGEVGDFDGDGRDDILQTAYRGDGNWGTVCSWAAARRADRPTPHGRAARSENSGRPGRPASVPVASPKAWPRPPEACDRPSAATRPNPHGRVTNPHRPCDRPPSPQSRKPRRSSRIPDNLSNPWRNGRTLDAVRTL
ncbi:MAG TPA: hypothetical protein VLG91_18815, partial [Streptomyces sp.]|nr:hypothetical protein [Streptomyces sp.]